MQHVAASAVCPGGSDNRNSCKPCAHSWREDLRKCGPWFRSAPCSDRRRCPCNRPTRIPAHVYITCTCTHPFTKTGQADACTPFPSTPGRPSDRHRVVPCAFICVRCGASSRMHAGVRRAFKLRCCSYCAVCSLQCAHVYTHAHVCACVCVSSTHVSTCAIHASLHRIVLAGARSQCKARTYDCLRCAFSCCQYH